MLTGNRDVDIMILNKLDDKDLVNACLTNKAADNVCNDDNFWFNRVLTTFPGVPLDVLIQYKGNRSWSEYYIEDLRKINKNTADSFLRKGTLHNRRDYVYMAILKGADAYRLLYN